jgi:LPS export ABC transporter protein LptC
MSSLTSQGAIPSAYAARRAVAKARLAPLLSWIAAAVGLVFVVVFLVQAGLFASLAPKQKITASGVDNPDQITSYDSTISGVDRNNQPYQLKAMRGWRDKSQGELMHMETVLATFHHASGEAYKITSKTAQFNDKLKEFDLADSVEIVQGTRFTARMDSARVMVEDKIISSDVPVEVLFGDSTIHANGLKITGDGANIQFLNGVKVRFAATPAKGDKAE